MFFVQTISSSKVFELFKKNVVVLEYLFSKALLTLLLPTPMRPLRVLQRGASKIND